MESANRQVALPQGIFQLDLSRCVVPSEAELKLILCPVKMYKLLLEE